MNRKRFGQIRRIIACCFAAIALLCHALPTLAETAAQGNSTHASGGETVRIGLYDKDSYHVIDENDRHSGYDHEYLQEISKYTGWNYEFVEGSWQECIKMIESGEIDLLGGVALHDEWKNTMCYAAEASANSSNCLLVDSQSKKYAYEDFDAFDGIRIGILTDSSIPDDIAIYAAENNFRYTLNQYATENELNAALANGEVDCLGLSDFRNLSSYKIIARISNTPLYYVTSLNRCDLKAQLDDALHRIHAQNKFYEYDLYDKYFNSAHQVAFTREEMAYIEANRHVRVALFQDIPMISTYVPSKDEYEGFIITILGRLSEKTGLQFEFIDVPTNQVPWDFLYENPNVLLAPLFQNNLIHYSERMRFLDTIVPSNMVAVTRSTESLASVSSGDALILAIPSGMFGATQEIKELFVNCEIVFCQSHQEGLDLVCDGKVDLTLINEILWTYLIQNPRYEKLKTFYLNHIVEDVTIGMSTSSDILLTSILNKAIQSFSQRDIQQIVMEHTSTHPYKLSFGEIINKNRLFLLLVLLSLMLLSIPMIWIHIRRQQNQTERQRREVTEARLKTAEIYQKELYHQANYDALTGLYNQKHFVERANDLMKRHPSYIYTFFHVNIANFKTINESMGSSRETLCCWRPRENSSESPGKKGFTDGCTQISLCCAFACPKTGSTTCRIIRRPISLIAAGRSSIFRLRSVCM